MFKKKFTEDDVIRHLSTKSMTLFELKSSVGSSQRTVWNLVVALMDKRIVERRNRSHPNKPVWEYYLTVPAGTKPRLAVERGIDTEKVPP